MKREHATAQARLCIARKALKEIANYNSDQFECYQETVSMLKYLAENAIREMAEVTNGN